MSNEMIERVAKEIMIARGIWPQSEFAQKHVWEMYNKSKMMTIAKAAIAAMREPTEAMLDAGAYDLDIKLETQYKNMIDAALKDD